MALQITAARHDPALLDLPWRIPLEEWPEEILAALPRGISRHVVRFVRLSGRVLAVKEIKADIAQREYEMLRNLGRMNMPCVVPFAVVSGREAADGTPLDACLITRHLQFSLPYRALYSQSLRKGTAVRLIDALAVLLVRLHLAGFWWGDVSLSNTLFRRDAGAFAAYLVDAETGELRPQLSDGQREHDLEIARVNIAGELMDLEAGGLLQEERDPVAVSARIVTRYRELWTELTSAELYEPVVRAVPRNLTGRLEPAEVFHEVLEHRWYLAERAQHDIPIETAIEDYLASVLPGKPDEQAVLGVDTAALPVISPG